MKTAIQYETAVANVGNFKRLIAHVIDWYLASLLAGLPIALYRMFVLKSTSLNPIIIDLGNLGYVFGILSIVLYLFYYVYIPLKKYKGQTFGKRLLGFKVVKTDGSDVDIKTLLKRELLGAMLLEGYIAGSSSYLHQMIQMALSMNLTNTFMYVFTTISMLSIFLAQLNPYHRMLHDFIAGTKVIRTE